MTVRSPLIIPAAILIMMAVLAAVVFGGKATPSGFGSQQPGTGILRVPGNYATIQAAIDAAKAGDIIKVDAGTYKENINLNKPVALTAATPDPANPADNRAVLDGGGGKATILIPIGLSQRPSIHGFVIRNSMDGIEAHSEFVAENNYFYGSQWSVEYLTGSGGFNRDNLYFNSANDAVHVSELSTPLLLENNRFMYAGDDAIEVDLQASPIPPTTIEMDIWNNMLIGSSQDGIKVVDHPSNPQDTRRSISIAGNLIANNRRAGLGLMHSGNTNEDYSAADTTEAVRAYNNTFYGNDYGISGGDNLVAFNNIIANTISHGAWKVQSAQGANSAIAYTLFWNNGVDDDQTTLGPGDIFGQDPLFIAAPGPGRDGAWGSVDDDFSGLLLRPDSPAIDKGVTQYVAANGEGVPPTPLTGFAGAAPDLGWREVGSPFFDTPTPIVTASVAATSTVTATAKSTSAPTATDTGTPVTSDTPSMATSTPGSTATVGSPTAVGTNTAINTAAAPPIIRGVTPATGRAGATLALTVNGSGFEDGATADLEGAQGSPPEVTAVSFVSPSELTLNIAVPGNLPGSEVWNLRVTNPDGASATLMDALTVTP